MTTKLFVLLNLAVIATEKWGNDTRNGKEKFKNNSILVKIEEDEYAKKRSKFIGVTYDKNCSKWRVQRWNNNESKKVYNGYFDDKETAAYASDTLARKLMRMGNANQKLNFPDDDIEVYPGQKSSRYIGVTYNKENSKWRVHRWNKSEKNNVYHGCYDDEEIAAHASDTLAKKLMNNDELKLKLNFPDDHIEIYPEERTFTSKYIGVTHKTNSKWLAQRQNKNENKMIYNGYYDNEETAAHASDTLARKLMKNGEQNHKLNFPDEWSPEKNQNNKRKRTKD